MALFGGRPLALCETHNTSAQPFMIVSMGIPNEVKIVTFTCSIIYSKFKRL